jgi:phosphatidate cytidylyltransferase
VIYLSYIFKLDSYLVALIFVISIIDLKKSNFFSISSLPLILIIIILLLFNQYLNLNLDYYLIIFHISLIFLSFFFIKINNVFFLINIIFFIYFLYTLSLSDRFLFYVCFIVSFINDTSAYIFGKFFKGPLIIPSISPKKTWSGTSLSSILSFFILYYLEFNIFVSLLLSISLFLGDIYFSYIKRINSLKDFSNLLSSHGGILDRVDSIFFFLIILHLYIIF